MTFRLILLLAILAGHAPGQAPPHKTRILTLSLDQTIEDVFFINDGQVQPFHAERGGLGAPVAYSGPRGFVLRATAAEFSAPPPAPPPLASVLLPSNSNLVLLVGGRAANGKIRLAAYDLSSSGFRAGDYRVFNFSEKAVSVILGKLRFALTPGTDRIVSDASWQAAATDVPIQMAHIENGKPRRVYSSVWGHQPVKRNLVFLFNGSHHTRPVSIRRFSDYPE